MRQVTPWQVSPRETLAFSGLASFSAVGTQISTIAVAWQVYEITKHRPSSWALTGLFRALPVTDSFHTRRGRSGPDGSAPTADHNPNSGSDLALILGLLTYTGEVKVWHIYAVTFLSGAVGIFDAPARTALIPLLVSSEQLASAYALNITWRQIATLAGPFLGGIIISAFGISTSYFIDALSFLSVITCLAFMRARSSPPAEKKNHLCRACAAASISFARIPRFWD